MGDSLSSFILSCLGYMSFPFFPGWMYDIFGDYAGEFLIMQWNIPNLGIFDVFCPTTVFKNKGGEQPEAKKALNEEQP